MAVLRRSNGSVIASNVTPVSLLRTVHLGHANPTVAGDKTFTDVTLLPARDALYLAASPANPVILGVDHVSWTPRRFPEQ